MNSSSVFLPLDSKRKPRDTTKDKLELLAKYDEEENRMREEIAEKNRILYEQQLQERINRMNCAKAKQKLQDSEFHKQKIIQMFINNCDDIRPQLRKLLQRDSKICQLEQINDGLKRKQEQTDLENAWTEISCRTYRTKTDYENICNKYRMERDRRIQEFQKEQMYDKSKHKSKQLNEEIDQERKWISVAQQEELDQDKREIENAIQKRTKTAHAIKTQIRDNQERRRQLRENILELERSLNENARCEIDKESHIKKVESENFREEVFQYLEHLREIKKEISVVENEKQKLIADQNEKMLEEELQRIIEFEKKRALVNQEARQIQYQQIKRIEQEMSERKAKEIQENYELEELVQNQRRQLREQERQKQIAAKNYGKFLIDQIKNEELRREKEKQELRERIQRVESEMARYENLGREFVESYQDVLPLHPNLKIIKGFNRNHI